MAKVTVKAADVAVLKRARQLIGRRGGWTLGGMCQNRHGEEVPITAAEACRFCVSGALHRAAIESDARRVGTVTRLLALMANVTGRDSVVTVSDQRGVRKADVLRWFDKAVLVAQHEMRARR
jgi:hypothetical protein